LIFLSTYGRIIGNMSFNSKTDLYVLFGPPGAGKSTQALLLQEKKNLTYLSWGQISRELDNWYKKYKNFINEKTYIIGTRRWRYTHRRVRSAYNSLKKNLPLLYTYQKYPELNIPNTTNSLDGYWSRLKNLLSAHRGKNSERKRKIVTEILRKQTA
jgi:hypothetical protein